MGKRCYRLWPRIISFNNLRQAFKKAAKGKRGKESVAAFEFRLEENLLQLQSELRKGSYQPGEYHSFFIHDPKRRLISAAPFRDRVVHHALVRVIEPLFERRFIFDSYANRKGKGTHKALDRCTGFMRRFRYVLPVDVKQFFPTIDHEYLLDTIAQTIGDPKVLALCEQIIATGQGLHEGKTAPRYFPGNDLFTVFRPAGIPIGNLTSQFWANVFLNPLDHFIKRTLKCKGYLRYVDDALMFSDSKGDLHRWRSEVIVFLADLGLTIHENRAQPRPTSTGVPFLGFQVFPDRRRLKRRNAVQARRRLKAIARRYRIGAIDQDRVKASVQGWVNHARYGDTWGLRGAVLRELRLPPEQGGQLGSETISDFQ